MNLERFKQLIDIYGGHPNRWPADERQAAQHLLHTSAIAQKWQQEACALDLLLDSIAERRPSLGLKSRILANTPAFSSEIDLWQWLSQWLWGTTRIQRIWRPALVFGLPIFLGVGLGLSVSYQQTRLAESTIVTQNELTNTLYSDQHSLTEWATWL